MTVPYYTDDLVTLYYGNCLEIGEWLAADVLVTDPPYGISWKQGTNKTRMSKPHAGIKNDGDTAFRDAALAAFQGKPAFVFGSWRAPAPDAVQTLVWRKPIDAGVVGSVTGYRLDTELIFMVGRWPKRASSKSSVITTDRGMRSYTTGDHPHAKPIKLMQELVIMTAGVIADPFAGCGATLVAAASLGRKSIGVELEEQYCEVIAKRLSQQAFDLGALA